MTSTTTTKTNTDLSDKVKVTFNEREVGYVHVEYIAYHIDPHCQKCNECETCYESGYYEECMKCHRDWSSISTHDFIHRLIAFPKEYPKWKGVSHIRFKTDSTFLWYDTLDANDNILLTHKIPIKLIEAIYLHQTEPDFSEDEEEEITHLRPDLKKSLK
jgi:hypothetical protein